MEVTSLSPPDQKRLVVGRDKTFNDLSLGNILISLPGSTARRRLDRKWHPFLMADRHGQQNIALSTLDGCLAQVSPSTTTNNYVPHLTQTQDHA